MGKKTQTILFGCDEFVWGFFDFFFLHVEWHSCATLCSLTDQIILFFSYIHIDLTPKSCITRLGLFGLHHLKVTVQILCHTRWGFCWWMESLSIFYTSSALFAYRCWLSVHLLLNNHRLVVVASLMAPGRLPLLTFSVKNHLFPLFYFYFLLRAARHYVALLLSNFQCQLNDFSRWCFSSKARRPCRDQLPARLQPNFFARWQMRKRGTLMSAFEHFSDQN